MQISAIVLAAGKGRRIGGRIPKPLIEIDSCPIIVYSLKVLSEHPFIKEIVIVANSRNRVKLNNIIEKYRISKLHKLTLGGRRRQDSVKNGLKAVNPESDWILIHDAVRPFITREMLDKLIKEAKETGAAILGVPVRATIKEVERKKTKIFVKNTLNRNDLFEIQTPQVFRKDVILEAYERFGDKPVTDDAGLVEELGLPVKVVFGSYNNIKITTPQDLYVAEAILKSRRGS